MGQTWHTGTLLPIGYLQKLPPYFLGSIALPIRLPKPAWHCSQGETIYSSCVWIYITVYIVVLSFTHIASINGVDIDTSNDQSIGVSWRKTMRLDNLMSYLEQESLAPGIVEDPPNRNLIYCIWQVGHHSRDHKFCTNADWTR